MKGLSFYMCFGKNAGFRTEFTKRIYRIVLWRVSFAILRCDIEQLMDALGNKK